MNHPLKLTPLQAKDFLPASRFIAEAMNPEEGRYACKSLAVHFRCRQKKVNDGRRLFSLKIQGRICAMVGLHHYDWGPRENVWLSWFSVHESLRRQGVGSLLIASVSRIALGLGYHRLFVETYSSPDFRLARAFYPKVGFRRVGGIRNYMPDGSHMVVYSKKLD